MEEKSFDEPKEIKKEVPQVKCLCNEDIGRHPECPIHG